MLERLQCRCVQVAQLRSLVAMEFRISKDRLRLVTGGKTLQDANTALSFSDGGAVRSRRSPRPSDPHLH